jgi:PEP-CTERM motif
MISRPNVLRLLALVACLSLARGAQASILTAYGVDSALGGSMNFTAFAVDYNNGMVNLTAKNSSATTTYHSVGLPLEFFYPADATGAPTGNGFNYLGGGAWRNAGGTQELDFTGVLPPFSSIFQPLLPALINVPLTDSIGPFSASVMSTDSVPLVELGDFGPGVSKSFTVLFTEPIGGSPPFHFVSDAFFVAVPEPSAIMLFALGMIGLLLVGRRARSSISRSQISNLKFEI